MSYYAGITIYEEVKNKNKKKKDIVLREVEGKEDLYVCGRYELHTLWGSAYNPFSPFSLNTEHPYPIAIFNRPDLDGKEITIASTNYNGEECSSTRIVHNVDFNDFHDTILSAIKEHEKDKGEALKTLKENTNAEIKDLLDRIDSLRQVQLQAGSNEVFDRFQNQINNLFTEIADIKYSTKETEDYYTKVVEDATDYDHDFGNIDYILMMLDEAEKALAEGKVVSVFGE